MLLIVHPDGTKHPVAYASRTMTAAERRYAQIEKFEDFIMGLEVRLETDHKPLLPIFTSKGVDDLTPTLQRFRLRMMRYSYIISYVPGKQLLSADALSRAPLEITSSKSALEEETDAFVQMVISSLPASEARLEEIKLGQTSDPTISKIIEYVTREWPEKSSLKPTELPYFQVKDELVICDEILLRNCRLVIPPCLQQDIIERLHNGHLGVNHPVEAS